LLLLALLPACVAPPARDTTIDDAMKQRNERLRPEVRGPIDNTRRVEADPPPPAMDHDVMLLASPNALDRIQADNRLRARGVEGILVVARFLPRTGTTTEQLVEAVEFLTGADLKDLDAAQGADVRALLAVLLAPERPAAVRKAAAWALRAHGPGAQRTVFLRAIEDKERAVRWAVVERFGENPQEVEDTQRLLLVKLLQAGTADEFAKHDENKDGFLAPIEFTTEEEFKRMDVDNDRRISEQEWLFPVDSAIRTDVVDLLRRLHARLTPLDAQINYNPDLPGGQQREAYGLWKAWAEKPARAE
jgi:hypothetical protein